jgi:Tol biopolymer transport system component
MAAACSGGELLVLGDRDPPVYEFDAPEVVPLLSAPARCDNPSLTADQLEIYFTSERAGAPTDIWRAERSAVTQPFGKPELMAELNSSGAETSPIVAADGLQCWFASDRPGGAGDLDVWLATRKRREDRWSVPHNLPELSSPGKDIPRAPGLRGSTMPLGSDRSSRGYYQVYFATSSGEAQQFASPRIVAELVEPDTSTVDAFLTDDGLTLFFVKGPAFGPADMFVTSRRSTAEPFAEPAPLSGLNTVNDERDPWLSSDGELLYFSSDRSGHYAIYVARVRRGRTGGDD